MLKSLSCLVAAALLVSCGETGESGSVPELVPFASCAYSNPFSDTPECREYLGPRWDEARVLEDCTAWTGSIILGGSCDYPEVLGRCSVDAGRSDELAIVFPGSDTGLCESSRTGCEVFAAGDFEPVICAGGGPPIGVADSVFIQPTLSCTPPLAGEAPGASEGGDVCTWNAISACTEPGRKFADYGSCETVLTQRPYYPRSPAEPPVIPEDSRAEDPDYLAELDWVRSEVEACACVCCHSDELAPGGPANWFVEQEPFWVDTFAETGLALGAGWVDSTSFGAFAPEDNNGFDRSQGGFPTTDPDRMRRFFEGELERRGFAREDFTDTRPFGGPLYNQLVYEPARCEEGVGVIDGRLEWTGGAARYVYVLEDGSGNPLTPPNLDIPEGTLWRVDVPAAGEPLNTGVVYGELPSGATQRVPEDGAPVELVTGRRYYLYVLADVGIPLTRCVFDAS